MRRRKLTCCEKLNLGGFQISSHYNSFKRFMTYWLINDHWEVDGIVAYVMDWRESVCALGFLDHNLHRTEINQDIVLPQKVSHQQEAREAHLVIHVHKFGGQFGTFLYHAIGLHRRTFGDLQVGVIRLDAIRAFKINTTVSFNWKDGNSRAHVF